MMPGMLLNLLEVELEGILRKRYTRAIFRAPLSEKLQKMLGFGEKIILMK